MHVQVEKSEMDSSEPISVSTAATTVGSSLMSTNENENVNEIQEEGGQQPQGMGSGNALSTTSAVEKMKLDRSNTIVIPEDVIVGRSTEKQKVINSVGQPNDNTSSLKVISVWGMGGIGKTTLVRTVYRSQQLGEWKRAWATALRPFSPDALLRNLCLQLLIGIQEDSMAGGDTQKKKNVGTMGFQDMIIELSQLLEKQKCLIVLDDLSSNQEWDSIKDYLAKARRVILTTREKTVAKHCSGDDRNMHCLNGLEDDAAFELFKKKVLQNLLFLFPVHSKFYYNLSKN